MTRLANLGLFILFPVYIVYHYLVAVGWIPAFAGGLFGSASALFAVAGVCYLGRTFLGRRADTPRLEMAFVALCLSVIGWSAGASLALPSAAWVSTSVFQAVSTVAIWIAVFFVGACREESQPGTRRAMHVALAVVGVLFVHSMVTHRSFTGPFLTFGAELDSDSAVSSYQGIGRALMVTSIMSASHVASGRRRWLTLSLVILALLSLGSRAHLFGMIFVMAATAGLLGFRRGSRGTAAGLALSLVVVAVFSADLFKDTRAAQVLSLDEASSWQARIEANREALDAIKAQPILGSFGYHNRDSVAYAHNALSAWAEWGLPLFLFYSGLILFALVLSSRRLLLYGTEKPLWLAAFQLNCASFVLAASTETVFSSVLPALGWGLTVAALRKEERLRRNRKTAATRNELAGRRSRERTPERTSESRPIAHGRPCPTLEG